MIISNKSITNIIKAYQPKTSNPIRKKESEIVKSLGQDGLNISEESKIKQQALQTIKKLPEVRQDKVDKLRQEIAMGTYHVSDTEVAEKILRQAVFDERV